MGNRHGVLRSTVLGGILAGSLLVLTGCVGGEGFAVLDREPTADDVIREGVLVEFGDDMDPDSARFVGEHNGNRLYVLTGEPNLYCILIDPGEQEDGTEKWGAGCAATGSMTTGTGSGQYTLVPDNYPIPSGATQISENVYTLR